jgi:phosphatidylserine decarboxylase
MKKYGADRNWPFAEGGGATIFVATAFFVSAAVLWFWRPGWLSGLLLVLVTALWLLILYFFRDPKRQPPAEPGVVLSPGDGEVVAVVEGCEARYLKETVRRISIFLSVTDVHVQRSPVTGRVALVEHRPGKFLQAFRPEASEVNESIAMIIESEHGGRILVKQIAGILARRCVNYAQVGDELTAGQRFGLIRFGSRVDLFLPLTAEVLVRVGDQVAGGLTPLARFSTDETTGK